MNDMIVEYKREIYKSVLTSKVVKVIDTFVPKHDGANWQNGFGYQLTGIANSDIKKITVESGGIVSQFMEGQEACLLDNRFKISQHLNQTFFFCAQFQTCWNDFGNNDTCFSRFA